MDYINILAKQTGINQLEGGTFTIDSILDAIHTFSTWAITVGISLAGLSVIIGFILFSVVDVDQKARVKQRIVQTFFGLVGIILAISFVNIIIGLFT